MILACGPFSKRAEARDPLFICLNFLCDFKKVIKVNFRDAQIHKKAKSSKKFSNLSLRERQMKYWPRKDRCSPIENLLSRPLSSVTNKFLFRLQRQLARCSLFTLLRLLQQELDLAVYQRSSKMA